jgi:hypothetical protein
MSTRGAGDPPVEVLHVRIVTGAGGGPEKTILNSPRHLVGTRYRETACWLHAPGDPGIALLEARARERGCPFVAVEDPRPYDVGTLRRMAALCRERGIRIWHGHDYKSNLFGVLLARLCDLRLATTVHGWVKHTEKTPFYFAVDRSPCAATARSRRCRRTSSTNACASACRPSASRSSRTRSTPTNSAAALRRARPRCGSCRREGSSSARSGDSPRRRDSIS